MWPIGRRLQTSGRSRKRLTYWKISERVVARGGDIKSKISTSSTDSLRYPNTVPFKPSPHTVRVDTQTDQQPNGFRINVIFSDKQHNYLLISICEWPLCLCEQTDGLVVTPDAWERSTPTTTHWRSEGRGTELSSHGIRLSHFNEVRLQFTRERERERWRRKKERSCFCPLITAWFPVWICDLQTEKRQINGKTWTFHEPAGKPRFGLFNPSSHEGLIRRKLKDCNAIQRTH